MHAGDLVVGDTRLAQPRDATVVGAAGAHRTEVPDVRLHRGRDRGDVELVRRG